MHNLTLKTFRITILLGLLLSCFALQAQIAVPFTPRKQVSIKGDITMIGNNIVNRKTESYTRSVTTREWNGRRWVNVTTTTTYPGKDPNMPYPYDSDEAGNKANDDFNMRYIDIDGDTGTFSSSKATLTVPDITCSKVIYAALYWSATYRNNFSDDTGGRDAINSVKLKLPGDSAYTPINGTIIYDGFNGIFAANGAYACYADVTSLVSGLTNPNGEYTVADILATQGSFGGGISGGWNLFVIYENSTYSGKYITAYDGFAGVNAALGSVDVDYSGFVTVPSPLTVKAKLATAALEGDNQINGDQLLFRGGATTNPFNQLSNTKNPANNFFNSNITYLDADGVAQDFTARTPASGNTLGFDSDLITIPTGYLPNGSTQATLQIKSTQDTYYMFFNALSVDMIEPEIRLVKTVFKGNVNVAGQDVTLGDELRYVVSFKNISTSDHAKEFTIKDILPVNTSLLNIDMSNVPGGTWVQNPTTKEITFSIPDNLVKKGNESIEHQIVITVKIASTCNELTDACANRIENTAYASYRGVENTNLISNDPSIAGITGTCNTPVLGPANFIVDVSNCVYSRTEVICNGMLKLKAGDGYGSHAWFLKNPSGDIPMGNTQEITVTTPGNYYVINTPIAPCLAGLTENIEVKLWGDLTAVSPVEAVADTVGVCTNNGTRMSNIFLCGLNDSRLIPSNIATGVVTWEKLNTVACNDTALPDNCPNNACAAINWQSVATGSNFTVTTAGQYRLSIDQDGTGSCRTFYYFNVYKNDLDPQTTVKDIVCTRQGEIRVIGVPNTYQIKLIDQSDNSVLVDYPNTNPVFAIANPGSYKVEIKQTGVPNGCIFVLKNILVLKKELTVNVFPEDKTCLAFGSIRVQALNVNKQYYYELNGPVNLTHGPVDNSNYVFPDLNAGTYTVKVTTDDGCTYTGTTTINDYSTLALNAAVKQSISCDPGQIQLTPSGGLAPYIFAVYSKNGVPQSPGIGDYILGNPVEILAADAGTYVFITKDANGCTVLSNPVTINNIPGVTYTTTQQNSSCNGANDGTFTFNVTATNGYSISYEVIDVNNNIVEQNATGIFTDLETGTYTANLIQTGVTNTCNFPTTFTITQPAALTGTASITTAYTCVTGGATVTVNVPSVTGGTTPYEYSIDGTNFGTATTFTGLTAGTYRVTIKDAKGCSMQTTAMTVAPLNAPTNITFTASALTCPAQAADVTLAVTGGNAPFTYQIILPSTVDNGTNNEFNGLAPNTYTFRVTDAKGCTIDRSYTINAITPITVTGVNNNNVVCYGTATGSLTYTVTGFGTAYDYLVTSSGTTVPAASGVTTGTINLTNLAAGTYTITVTNPATNCTATKAITIDAPTAVLALTKTVTQPTCNAQGSVVASAAGGWGSNAYELTDGTTVQNNNNGTFTALIAGSYTLKVTDGNGCVVTDTFTIAPAVAPVLEFITSDLCYDANGASVSAGVQAGTGKAPFKYKLDTGAYQSGSVFSTLTPGTHTISVQDANNCTSSVTFTINLELTATAVLTKALDCTALPDAVITVNIAGGLTDYHYQVSFNGGTYGSIADVTGNSFTYNVNENDYGFYKFKITDDAGCLIETTEIDVMTSKAPVILSLVPTDVLCYGANTGAITVNLDTTKGVGPFTYTIYRNNNGTNYGNQTTGLPAGIYTVIVYGSNGCQANLNVEIDEPDAITFDTSETNIRCVIDSVDPSNTISAGEILVKTVAGGTGEYTYVLTNNFGYSATYGPTTDVTHPFVILNYGIYQVTITDENGCTAVKPNIIMASPPNQLAIVVDTTPSTCATGGKATVTVGAIITGVNYRFGILQTNVPPYTPTYVGPDVSTAPRTATFANLVPGVTYTFVVYDMDTRCYYFQEKTIDDVTPSNLAVNILTVNEVTCKGSTDGNVIFSYSGAASGATVNYQVYRAQSNTAVTGAQGSTIGTLGTDTIGGLAPGVYYVQFEEVGGANAGCKIASAQFTIAESATILTINASVAKNDNCTLNAGQIVISAQDGTGPYTYQVVADGAAQPTTWVGTNSFNRESGTYDAYIKDANGCIKKADITIPLDPSPVISLNTTPVCTVSEASASIAVTITQNGIAPYTYSLDGGPFQTLATPIYNGIASGTHTITIRDANGCTDDESITIYPPLNVAPAIVAQPTCPNDDGAISATATGGSAVANYRFTLQTAAGAPVAAEQALGDFTALAAGDYKVIVRDIITNCTKEGLVTLDAAVPVTFTTTQTEVSCNGGTDGTITVSLLAGNTDVPYTYSITSTSGTLTQNDGLFNNLAAGVYTVTVASGKNCSDTSTVTITQPTAITVSATATDFACATDNTVNVAVITITASGGTGTKLYSINGTNYYTTNTFDVVDNGADQPFTVYVKDANNCEETSTVTVNRLPAITAVDVDQATEITCNNDETVTLTVTGGSGNFTFDVLPLGTQPSVTPGAGVQTVDFDLPETGSYTFKVTDNITGCTFTTAAYTIAPFDVIDVAATTASAVTCFGATDGTITIEITDYTGSFQYEVLDAANAIIVAGRNATTTGAPFAVTNVPAGNYFVKVTANDTPYCAEDTASITVPGPVNALTLTVSPNTSVTCTNDKGEITAQATGGWGTYEYELINNTTAAILQEFDANNTFTGLAAGSYTVNVKDMGGCTVTQTVTFTLPTAITADISASVASVLCYGNTTASVQAINVTGGQGTYQYVLNTYDAAGTTIVSSTGSQTSPVFNGLGAGKYSISVIDGWNCGTLPTGIVTITQPDQLIAILDVSTNATCLTSAQLELSATGGTPPYQYSVDNITYNSTNTFTVTPGTYKYYVKDNNNCTAVLSNSITIMPVTPVTIDLNLAGAEISCADDTTAVIIAKALGGLGNYQYELLNGANANVAGPQADGTFSGLAAGDYIVRVTSGDCSTDVTVPTIINPDPFVVTPTVVPLLCFGDPSGKIIINTTGGTGAVQYAISPNLDQFDNNNEFDNLAAGTYDVIVQDMNGCFEFLHLIVTEPDPIVASIVILTNETCLGEGDGTVEVDINGGTGSYAYSLDYNETTQTGTWTNFTTPPYIITGIAPGEITINIKDQNNCFLNPPIDQEILPGVDLQPTADVTTDCTNNIPANTVTVSLNTGVTAANVTYSLDGTTYQPGNVFNNVALAPGTHQVFVKHTVPVTLLECIKTADFTIDVHDPIVASAAVTENVLCFGGTTGEIEVTATGGTTPLEYAISPAYVYGTNNVFTGLAAGTYDVKVKDAITCEVTTASVTITEPATALTATVVQTDETCFDANDGTITVTISGGTAPYEVSLDGGTFVTVTGTTHVFDTLADGTYTIDVRDSNTCSITQMSETILNGVDMQPSAVVTPNCVANTPNNDVEITIATGFSAADISYSLDGTTYQASNIFANVGLAPNTYTAYVKHANDCIQTADFTIDVHDPIVASAAVTENVLCFGSTTGEIEVTATGGTTPLEYAISPAYVYGTNNVFTGLAAGTYDVKVKDAITCEVTTASVTITEPATAVTATVTHTDEICINANDGTITITPSGGVGSYETSLDGAAFTSDLTYDNLADGTYTIDVKDTNGCAITQQSVTIAAGVFIDATTEIIYNCDNNVIGNVVFVRINTSLTAADVTYSLDGGIYQASEAFGDVAVGNHNISVLHANGCEQIVPFTIDAYTPITASADQTDVLCNGAATGEIEITATGGTGALRYAISNATPPVFDPSVDYDTVNVFTSLTAGTYTVSIMDDNLGCETQLTVTITEPATALSATLTHTDETCFDADNGSITVTISGGTAPYEVSLDGGTFVTVTGTTHVFDTLADGTYTIDVRDSNTCSITQMSETIQNGVDMQPSAAVNPNCVANTPNNDVEITIATGFAAADISYSLDGTTYQASNTFTNVGLAPNTYTAYVKHANGCIQTTTFTIDIHDPIVASATVIENVLCFEGTTGEIEVTATGGTTPLEYAISPAYVYGTNNVFTGLAAGTYDVKVKDAITCEVTTASVTITEPATALTATAVHTDETCFDANDGSITVTISGGTAPYEVSLDGGTFVTVTGTTHVFDTLADGTYTIDVRDSNTCSITQMSETILNGVDTQPSAAVNPNCVANTPNNDVEITIATGFAASDISYSLDGTTYQASNTFTNVGLAPNTYTAYVKHANGCIQTTTFTIDVHNPIVASAAVTENVLCFEGTTGEIEVTATGGTTPLEYAISPAYVYGTDNVFTGLAAGTYDVKVKDAITCEITTASVTITEPVAALSATLTHTDETCFDADNGSITVTISGGTAPYEVSLDGGTFVTVTGTTYLFDTLADGTYTIDVRDINMCSITQMSETIQNGVDMQPSAEVTPNCVANTPNNDVEITIATGFAASDISYSLDGTTYQPSNIFANVGLAPNTYTAYVKHANGCIQTTTFTIDVHDPIVASAAVTDNVLCFEGTTGEIEVTATGGTTPLEYAISPAYVYGTNNVFTGLSAGTYDVKVKDAITCEVTTASVTITEPATALTATAVHTDETCFDADNGSITVTISGGTAPYEVSLDGGTFVTVTGTTHLFDTLADGTYTIDVRDINMCSITQISETIQNGVDMQPSAAVNPNCVANTPNNDVEITIATGFAAADISYSLDGTTYQASNTFTNVGLAPNTYTAYVKHANGCIQTTTFTIDVHDPIVASAAVTENVLCFGGTTGEIEVTATGGTTPLEYAISPAYVYGTNNVFTGLAAGTYDVKVKDAITCEITTASVTITEPATAVTATITHTDEICINANDGTITITPSGGVGSYETSLDGAAFTSDLTYDNLADGIYTIDVRDTNGCAITQQSVTIAAGVFIDAEAEVVPNCDNNVIGNVVFMSVDDSVIGDVTYSLDGGTYQASEIFADVTVGNHNISVLHTNGCEQIVPFTIDAYTSITASADQTDVFCNGAATGEIEVTATGGTGALSYAISNAMPPVFAGYDVSNVFTGLTAGTYTVSVLDDNLGCETQLTVTITEPAEALSATLTHTDETCFDANDGSITVTISGGTAPYETSLNGAAYTTATSFTTLADGTYTIDVRDANTCSIVQISETIQNGVDMQPSAAVNPNCVANTPNNDVEITIATGLAASDISYSLDGTTYQASNTFTNVGLIPNTYTAYVKHANGCIQTTTFTIDVHDPIVASAAVTENVLCFGGTTGEIEVTATGGTTPLEYAISPAYVYGTNNVFTGLAAGTYDVKVKDAITCEVTTASVTITEPATALTATAVHTDETCFDANDGSITVTISGGTAPYEVSLDGGTFVTVTGTTHVFDTLADGTYTIDVRDINTCSITQISETILNGVDMQPSATVNPNCVANTPNNDVEITIATGFAASDISYSLDGTTYQASNTFTNVGLIPNTYTAYVKHANGCIQTTTFTIDVHTPLMHTGTLTLNITCYGNDTGEATLSVAGGTGQLQYAMAPDYVYQTSNIFTGLAPGTYDFKVKDAIGCEIEINDVIITEPFGPLDATVDHTDETCFNSNDGTITVNITGGTPPYFTSLDGAPYVQGQTVYSNLADGTHTINVNDAFACTIPQQSVVIVNGVNMLPVATVTPNCVNNAPDNNVVITIAAGITPADVTYSIDGINYQASNTFANVGLAAANYTAYVQHTNGCIQQTQFTIAPHAPVMASVTSILPEMCFGNNTGEITVTATGGTTPLEYAIANENATPLVFSAYQASNIFTGLTAGTYTISVKDVIGCEVVLTGNQVNGPTATLTATAALIHESCINDDDGQIDITVTGGTGPYSTSLNGAPFIAGQMNYANLDGGNYTVNVQDANGCQIGSPIAVTINQGVQLQVSAAVNQVCENVEVTVMVNATATGTVTYTLDGIYTQSSNVFTTATTPMAAGQHTIAVTHSAGCTEEVTFNVTPIVPIVVNYTKTDVTCRDIDSGVIVVNPSGGTAPYQYAISYDTLPTPVYGSDNTFDELFGDKDYVIYVKDALGCIQQTTVHLNQPAEKLVLVSVTPRPETCLLDRNGGIDIVITGGTPPYYTALNSPTPNNFQEVTSYDNLYGGTYDVYVKDAVGCVVLLKAVVVENGVDLIPYYETVTSCENNVPVNRVTVKLRRTVTDVTYSLDVAGPFTANNVFELPSGQHTIYIKHKNGCEKTLTVIIQDRSPITAQVNPVDAKCNGEANGTITVTPSGGTGALKYAIANANVTPLTFSAFQTSNVFTGLAASNAYVIRIEDAYGCFAEVNGVVVGQPDAIVLTTPIIIQEEICINDGDAAIELEIPTGGTAPYATSLNEAGPFEIDQYLFDNLQGGKTYTIYVQDANGCIAATSVTLAAPMDINAISEVAYDCEENTITIVTNSSIPTSELSYVMTSPKGSYPPQSNNMFQNLEDGTYVVEVINTVTGCSDVTEPFVIQNAAPIVLSVTKTGLNQITANATGGTGVYRYSFDGNDTGTKNTYTYPRSGRITVIVTDSRNCTQEITIDVIFIDIVIPDVMTPDGDGQNDVWSPGNTQNYPNINTDIFDRYGRKLATLRQGQTWDGKYDGEYMPTGDYWYLIKLGDAEGRDFVGHFTIYR